MKNLFLKNQISSIFTRSLKFCLLSFFILIGYSCEQQDERLIQPKVTEFTFAEVIEKTSISHFQNIPVRKNDFDNDTILIIDTKQLGISELFPYTGMLEFNSSKVNGRVASNTIQSLDDSVFSEKFKEYMERLIQFAENLDSKSYEQCEADIQAIIDDVESDNLTEDELSSVFYIMQYTKQSMKNIYENELDNSNKRLKGCDPNWRQIVYNSIQNGIYAGATLGLAGAIAGGKATLLSGQPWVGAVVGGFGGFVIGFAGGGGLTAAGSLVADCATQAIFDSRIYTYVLSDGRIIYSRDPNLPYERTFSISDLRPHPILLRHDIRDYKPISL